MTYDVSRRNTLELTKPQQDIRHWVRGRRLKRARSQEGWRTTTLYTSHPALRRSQRRHNILQPITFHLLLIPKCSASTTTTKKETIDVLWNALRQSLQLITQLYIVIVVVVVRIAFYRSPFSYETTTTTFNYDFIVLNIYLYYETRKKKLLHATLAQFRKEISRRSDEAISCPPTRPLVLNK